MGSAGPAATDLTSALASAIDNYTAAHPTSLAIHTKATHHLPGGNTRTVLHTPPFPLTISSAESCRLTTTDGPVLTDFLSEYTAAIFGHSHPVIKTALLEAVNKGWNYGAQCGIEGELAAKICSQERYGKGGMEMCRFVNSGTEANMMALSVASAYTGDRDWEKSGATGERKKRLGVLMFDKGYHGSVLSGRLDTRSAKDKDSEPVSSISADSNSHVTAAVDPQTQLGSITASTGTSTTNGVSSKTTTPPASTKPKLSLNLPFDLHIAPYNDIPATTALINSLPPQSLAAILLEPALGSGGCFPATPTFLSTIRQLADQTGALLIFDEVMTSRLGAHGYGYEVTSGTVTPDLMSLGKWIGGGMSFGAFGGSKEIMSLFVPGSGRMEHPGTFNNNVFTMKAGNAGLDIMTPDVLSRLNALGEDLTHKIDAVLDAAGLKTSASASTAMTRPLSDADHDDPDVYEKYPNMFVKGVGSILTIHFTGPERVQWQQLFWLWMVENGFWIAARGFVALNIELTRTDVERFVRAVEGFVGRYGGDVEMVRSGGGGLERRIVWYSWVPFCSHAGFFFGV